MNFQHSNFCTFLPIFNILYLCKLAHEILGSTYHDKPAKHLIFIILLGLQSFWYWEILSHFSKINLADFHGEKLI
jgi:hypothetical protein